MGAITHQATEAHSTDLKYQIGCEEELLHCSLGPRNLCLPHILVPGPAQHGWPPVQAHSDTATGLKPPQHDA